MEAKAILSKALDYATDYPGLTPEQIKKIRMTNVGCGVQTLNLISLTFILAASGGCREAQGNGQFKAQCTARFDSSSNLSPRNQPLFHANIEHSKRQGKYLKAWWSPSRSQMLPE